MMRDMNQSSTYHYDINLQNEEEDITLFKKPPSRNKLDYQTTRNNNNKSFIQERDRVSPRSRLMNEDDRESMKTSEKRVNQSLNKVNITFHQNSDIKLY